MELQLVTLSDLYFPREEWRWLRPAAHYATNPDTAPEAFLWAARVNEKLWAWHPSGANLENGFPEMKTRALVLSTDGTEFNAHALYLKTTFKDSVLDVEWVAALQTLTDRLGYNPAEKGIPSLWKEAIRQTGLEPHLGVLAQRGRYSFLTREEQQLLFDKRWDLASLELLETAPTEFRTSLIASARKWNLTSAQTKEAISLGTILVRRMGEKTALNILNSNYKSAEEYRSALLRTAQPEFAALSQKRIEALRGLQMPARTSVFGDPNFEKDVLKITHTPRNMGDFENFKAWVEDPAVLEKVRALLEIYQ